MNNETPICQYCDKNAIGYERVYGTPLNTQVCEDCAHVETTVHLYSGGTWRKRSTRLDT